MLNTFWVKNYKNITMDRPLHFNPGFTFFYGSCGSGKTNLSIALADLFIQNDVRDQDNRRNAMFLYGFDIFGWQVWYEYSCDETGKFCGARFEIPQLSFYCSPKERIRYPEDIWNMVGQGPYPDKVKQLSRIAKKGISGTSIRIPELFCSKFFLEENKNSASWNSGWPGNPFRKEGVPLAIWDDADSPDVENLEEEIGRMRAVRTQGIFCVRRSLWMDDRFAGPENYYYIENGRPEACIHHVEKDIKTSKQLGNIYRKI